MSDDVGIWNISAYHRGMMGGRTPNIDRIAKEGAPFTDYYAQQSCTAGRAAFILGQTPFRTGLLKVGLSAAKQGLQDKDPMMPNCSNRLVTPRRTLTLWRSPSVDCHTM
jgi:arylsulfatase A-like enzyme